MRYRYTCTHCGASYVVDTRDEAPDTISCCGGDAARRSGETIKAGSHKAKVGTKVREGEQLTLFPNHTLRSR